MAGMNEGAIRGISDTDYALIAGMAESRLRKTGPESLGAYGPEDVKCAAFVLMTSATFSTHLRDVREELDLSSRDKGYRLAVAMFHKAHQLHMCRRSKCRASSRARS